MGHRLSKIYTRTGDKGTTGLGDGSRIEKDHPRIEAIGTVDELNSMLGLLLAQSNCPELIIPWLNDIQHDLFDVGGELCLPEMRLVKEARITELEQQIETMNEVLPPLKEFILPGGSAAASICHLARSICRRAERNIYTITKTAEASTIPSFVLPYVNRLSDWLFVCARTLARHKGGKEILWNRER